MLKGLSQSSLLAIAASPLGMNQRRVTFGKGTSGQGRLTRPEKQCSDNYYNVPSCFWLKTTFNILVIINNPKKGKVAREVCLACAYWHGIIMRIGMV